MAELKLKKWGNSLGLLVPKDLIKFEGMNEGDKVKVEIFKEKRIDGFGMAKGAAPFKEEEISHEEFW
ncbi:MAG: hypothetical protein V1740_04845 [Candidatus Woesearchaeota archaeon]